MTVFLVLYEALVLLPYRCFYTGNTSQSSGGSRDKPKTQYIHRHVGAWHLALAR